LSSAHAQDTGCLTVKKISSSHHVVQQGGDIEITANLVTSHCRIPNDAAGTIEKPVLAVQTPEGFHASLPAIEITRFETTPTWGNTWMAHEMIVHFELHAFREATAGEHAIPATLGYSALDEQGNLFRGSLALSIPVKVVPSPKPGYWDQHPQARKAWVTTGEVLLVIIALPVWIVANVLGFARGDC
jgi:hypothetical protein